MVDISPAAFLGTLCSTLPQIVDKRTSDGLNVPGFLPALEAYFGADSFGAGNGDTRFRTFLRSGTRMAANLVLHWTRLQEEVGADRGPTFRQSAEGAGSGVDKLQKALTTEREMVRFQHHQGSTCSRHAEGSLAQC